MKLTHGQIQLIKQSWVVFRSMNPALVGDAFYSKLFVENPSLRKMFPKQMDEQYKKLIDMLSVIVARLDHLDDLSGEIAAMGRRHVQYGVRPEHYRLVGNALLWTLENGLGNDWSEEVKDAWEKCYATLADSMINASKTEPHL
jgi:hemoglobin-like flavoprotein